MIRKALRRRASSFAFFILLGLLFTAGFIGSTYAYFDGEVDQTATYAGGFLIPPSGLGTPTALGYGAALAWTPATAPTSITYPTTTVVTVLLNAQALYGLDRGSNSAACPAFTDTTATYTALTTNITSTLATTTDAGNSAYNGHYYCYQVQSTHGSWYQGAVFAGIQVGLIPTAVTLANANNTMGNNDKITIVYNQAVTYASPITVAGCPNPTTTVVTTGHTTTQYGPGTAVVGGGCGSTGSVGNIGNLTMTGAAKTFTTSSLAGAGTKTITITLNGGANVASSGAGQFVPSGSNVKSSVGSATVCNCTTISDTGGF